MERAQVQQPLRAKVDNLPPHPGDHETPHQPRRGIRADLKLIADMIRPNTSALDVGSGDGELLDHLVHEKGVDGHGLELAPDGVRTDPAGTGSCRFHWRS